MRPIVLLVALLGSALAGLVAVRTTVVQPPVLIIAVVCTLLGFAVPRLAWLFALIVGLGVFIGYVIAELIRYEVKAPPMAAGHESIYGSLVALVPAFVFAYLGAGARWMALPGVANIPR